MRLIRSGQKIGKLEMHNLYILCNDVLKVSLGTGDIEKNVEISSTGKVRG